MAKVQLLSFWASPYLIRVEVALALKGVEYEKLPQDLREKSELLLQSNPVYKKIPVLLHNGNAVCESGIIVQYIDEAWSAPPGSANFLPADAYGRAKSRFWADYIDKKVFDAMFAMLKSLRPGAEEEKKAAEENIMGVMNTLEGALAESCEAGPFFGGEHMGLPDVMLVPLVAWGPAVKAATGLTLPLGERLSAWFGACAMNLTISSVLPETEKLAEFLTNVALPRLASSS